MCKTESIRENETQNYVGFQIQTDHSMLIRRQRLVIINKKNYLLVDFAVLVDYRVKIK